MLPRPFLEDVKSTIRDGGEGREGGSDRRSSWARADNEQKLWFDKKRLLLVA